MSGGKGKLVTGVALAGSGGGLAFMGGFLALAGGLSERMVCPPRGAITAGVGLVMVAPRVYLDRDQRLEDPGIYTDGRYPRSRTHAVARPVGGEL